MLYPWGKSPQYSLDRKIGGPQSQYGSAGEEEKSLLLPGIEPSHPACNLVTIPTDLSQLLIMKMCMI
jgi:hypothetical protein